MRKFSSAERFLLFRTRNPFSHSNLSQRWKSSAKAAQPNDDGLLDLLDHVGQDISIATEPRRKKRRKSAKPDMDNMDEFHSSILDLPLSPLMNPKHKSLRKLYNNPQIGLGQPPSMLEQKLFQSPYARALTSPIRHCRLTDAKLPCDFLLDFGVTKHPVTGAQWHLPRLAANPLLSSKENRALTQISLEDENADEAFTVQPTADMFTVDVSPQNGEAHENDSKMTKSTEIDNLDELPQEKLSGKLPTESTAVKVSGPQDSKSKVLSQVPVSRTGSSSYIISSQPALKLLSSYQPKSWMNILPPTWKTDSWINAEKLVWRKDMDQFVLELQRKKAHNLLELLASSSAGYLASRFESHSIVAHHQVAAVLWLGTSGATNTSRGRKSSRDSATSSIPQELPKDSSSSGRTPRRTPVLISGDQTSTLEAEAASAARAAAAAAVAAEAVAAAEVPTVETAAKASASEEQEPPFYAMVRYKSHFIPIYNLPQLLGSEHVAHLRTISPKLKGTMAVLKKKTRTVPAQMELWKLMGYMAPMETLGVLDSKIHDGVMSVLQEREQQIEIKKKRKLEELEKRRKKIKQRPPGRIDEEGRVNPTPWVRNRSKKLLRARHGQAKRYLQSQKYARKKKVERNREANKASDRRRKIRRRRSMNAPLSRKLAPRPGSDPSLIRRVQTEPEPVPLIRPVRSGD